MNKFFSLTKILIVYLLIISGSFAADYYNKAKPFTDIANGAGFWSSTEKIMSTTGWRPRIGIDEGIVSTLKVLDGR